MSRRALTRSSESGQTMAEYSVVLGVLILGVVAAIGFFGTAIAQYLTSFAAAIT